VVVPGACATLGPALVRRLTRYEYNNTVNALLRDTTAPAQTFPPEPSTNGYDTDSTASAPSRILIDGYHGAANGLAEHVVTDLNGLLGCAPEAPGCISSFIQGFGTKAYRHTLSTTEVQNFQTFYDTQRATFDAPTSVRMLLEVFLQSPKFLYRSADGADAFDTASRLSYTLWGSMPDDALLAAARGGQLATKAQVGAEASRLMADPKAKLQLSHFQTQWLGLDVLAVAQRDAATFPEYTQEMSGFYQQEMSAFWNDVVWNGPGDVKTLLTAPYSFMNQKLAAIYGIAGVTGDTFQKVTLDPTQRMGLLTQAGLLVRMTPANRSNPVTRGKLIRTRFMCETLPDPPASVNRVEPAGEPGQTTRERFAAHEATPSCAACHALIDGIGFGFENYDAIGKWRTTENGKPIDASGQIVSDTGSIPFVGAVELANLLATNPKTGDCLAKQWFTFALGRSARPEDSCVLKDLGAVLSSQGLGVRDLVLTHATSDAFAAPGYSLP